MIKAYASFHETTLINTELIKKFFKKNLFDQFTADFLPDEDCGGSSKSREKVESKSEKNLFIWCVLFNQFELSKLFWSGIHDVRKLYYFLLINQVNVLFQPESNCVRIIGLTYFESFCWKIRSF